MGRIIYERNGVSLSLCSTSAVQCSVTKEVDFVPIVVCDVMVDFVPIVVCDGGLSENTAPCQLVTYLIQ